MGGLAAVASKGKLYAIGGGHPAQASNGSVVLSAAERVKSDVLPVVERCDVLSDVWETVDTMPTPRMFLAAAVHWGKIYAIGGSDGAQALRTVEAYDDEQNCWQSLPKL